MTQIPSSSIDRPRILFVKRYHYTRAVGGAEDQIRLLSTELARRGWDVHCTTETEQPESPKTIDGVTVHSLPDNPPAMRGNRAELQQLFAKLKPQVVYNRGFDLYTAHGLLDAPPGSVRIWAAAMEGEGMVWSKLKSLRDTYGTLSSLRNFAVWYPTFRLAQKAVRLADLVFVQRQEQIEVFRKQGIRAQLFRNVMETVDESGTQSHSGIPVVLWVASVKDWKRPNLFVDVARQCRDLNAEFIMIGELQDPKYGPMLEQARRDLPQFRYDGLIPVKQVGSYYQRAHLLVNTSVSEGFSNTFIQAWVRKVPVIALNVDPEQLLSRGGLGYCAQDLPALIKAVRKLVADPAERLTIGNRARNFALEQFDLQHNVDKLEALLRERGIGVGLHS